MEGQIETNRGESESAARSEPFERLLPFARRSVWAIAAGLVVLAAYTVVNASGGAHFVFDRVLYNMLLVLGGALCLARAVAVPAERPGWLLLGTGLLIWTLGEMYWAFGLDADPDAAFPSLADAGYLAFYPLSVLGIALLVRARVRRFRPILWLDGTIAALTISALAATLVLPPIFDSVVGEDPGVVAATLAYPVFDLVLLAFVAGILVLSGWRPDRTWTLVAAGLGAMALADTIYEYQSAVGSYTEGGPLDVLWPLSAGLLALAAWQRPRIAQLVPIRGWRSVAAPASFALLAVGVVVYEALAGSDDVALALAAAALLCVVARLALSYRENQHLLGLANTDSLTGLGNRGKLTIDLSDELAAMWGGRRLVLAMFDLDGFKHYNDTFGHPAGDSLLRRLGRRLAQAAAPQGEAYRIGGDEFCVLISDDVEHADEIVEVAAIALCEQGEGFQITGSYGAVTLPTEAADPESALQLADRRMYAQKNASRASTRSQAQQVLMRTLRERQPELTAHVDRVTELSTRVARRFTSDVEQLDVIRRAAELHDVGKIAIPDSVLEKQGELNEEDWRFVREHTVVGDRILRSAPALAAVADVVRSTHERFDGTGYPDGLRGDQIPLGSRIVFVCDAFSAMTTDRPYSPAVTEPEALEELRRCAGTQFDPAVVEALADELAGRPLSKAEIARVRPGRTAPGAGLRRR